MNNKNEDILCRELEIPERVWNRAGEIFTQIHRETAGEEMEGWAKNKRKKQMFRLQKVAAAALICFVIFGTTVTAMEIVESYRQRMERMGEEEKEALWQLATAGETSELNRSFTAEENKRMLALTEEYEEKGLFPEKELTILSEAADYDGKGVAIDAQTWTIYLPERTLSDEELLEIIDYSHKMEYALYEHFREQRLASDGFESRMAAMTNEEVDRIYLAYCAANLDISGGYSRELSPAEKERCEELNVQYETACLYPETDLEIIKTLAEYSGKGVAFCEENCGYCLPDAELSDEEMLQIIDFEHKIMSCFERLAFETQMGLRDGYPTAK